MLNTSNPFGNEGSPVRIIAVTAAVRPVALADGSRITREKSSRAAEPASSAAETAAACSKVTALAAALLPRLAASHAIV